MGTGKLTPGAPSKVAAGTALVAAVLVTIFGPKIGHTSTSTIAGYVVAALAAVNGAIHIPTAKKAAKKAAKVVKPKPKRAPAPAPKFTTMFDATNLRGVPRIASTSQDVIAAYDDGEFNNISQARALYPGHRHLTIGVRETDPADMLDSEPGNTGSTPQERAQAVVRWIKRRQAARARFIGVYADGSDWTFIADEMRREKISVTPLSEGGPCFKLIADPTGHPHIPEGFDGCQYLWEKQFDESIVYTVALRNLPRG